MCSPTSLIIFYSFSTFIYTSISTSKPTSTSTSSLVFGISRAWSENEPLWPFYRCRPIVKKQKRYTYIRRKRNTRIRKFIFEENYVKFSFYSFEHCLRSDKSLWYEHSSPFQQVRIFFCYFHVYHVLLMWWTLNVNLFHSIHFFFESCRFFYTVIFLVILTSNSLFLTFQKNRNFSHKFIWIFFIRYGHIASSMECEVPVPILDNFAEIKEPK